MFSRRKIKNLNDVKKSKAFCINPWVHLFVSQKGTVGPCCLTSWEEDKTFGNINKQSVEEIWHNEKINSFRKSMLQDKQDERCNQCYQNEKNGLRSKRKTVNFIYADYLNWVNETKRNGKVKNSKPIYWDIRISNLCNLKCRICGHHSSSSWFEDSKQLNNSNYETKIHKGPENFNQLIDQLDHIIDDLEEVYFAGGEPILMPEHHQLITKFVERKKFKIKLRYNTNFSQTNFKDADFLEIWKQFDDVFIHASLDDSGQRGILQRKGLDWNLALENRKRMLEICPKVDFIITTTISVFNIFHIANFHQEMVLNKFIKIDEFIPHVLKSPAYYNIRILPPNLKAQVKEIISKHINWIIDFAKLNPPDEPKPEHLAKWGANFDLMNIPIVTGHGKLDIQINEFRQCLIFMESADETHLIHDFIDITDKLDKLRDESTQQIIPELATLWNVRKNSN